MKYADLSQNRITNYQFSFDRMLALQGNTAPYLLYAVVRIAGIARKGGDLEAAATAQLQFSEPQEWALVRELLKFDAVIAEVEEELLPNRLCSYLFELSQVFNRFYDQVPVLKADADALSSRLALCRLTADTLRLGLGLLGIATLERMWSGTIPPLTPGGAPPARADVERLKAYSAPPEGRRAMLRLDFNENTIGPSPLVAQAVRGFSTEEIAVYPEYDGLRDAVVRNLLETGCRPGLTPEQVGLFNGVDAAIHAVFQAYGDAGDRVLTTSPTFGYYSPCAGMQGMAVEAIPYEGEGVCLPLGGDSGVVAAGQPSVAVDLQPEQSHGYPAGSGTDRCAGPISPPDAGGGRRALRSLHR